MQVSFISKEIIPSGEQVQLKNIRNAIFEFIKRKYPDIEETDFISLGELNQFRRLYLTNLIQEDFGGIADLDKEVLEAIKNNSILSENSQQEIETTSTFGQRVADKVASFGGSWTFIICFFSFIVLWMITNLVLLKSKSFDPYPFILLNLILSCIAAIQAPIIMMSQNRQEQKDRIRAEHDYQVNLKAELEITLLNEKIDYLLAHQNQRLLEIQQIQTDYLEDLVKAVRTFSDKK